MTDADVDAFFRIPPGESRLQLLNTEADYIEYPHARFALPSENQIERFVRDTTSPRKQTVNAFVKLWGEKEGVREKVGEVLGRRTVKTDHGLKWIE
jgi:3-hydroxyisobutyryl-CoA hydrolase